LLARTGRRTVPHMFGRHRTAPDRDLAVVAQAFHERLARSMVIGRTDPPRVDPRTCAVGCARPRRRSACGNASNAARTVAPAASA
jgi:hypothetical protein